ncbi:MAG: hypothetical protein IKD04_04865 [Clostridia bacterium]|nr:hypothetical protein [Clostridia bacterium]
MTAGNRVVKITAKTALKGRYLGAIFSSLCLIFSVIIGELLASLVEFVSTEHFYYIFSLAYSIFITVPLLLGLIRYFWRLLFAVEDSPVSVFYYLSTKELYLKAIKLNFSIILRAIPAALILFFPVIAVWVLSQSFIFELINIPIPMWTANLDHLFVFLRTFSSVLLCVFMLKYYMSPLLFVADENMDVNEAIYMSATISKKSGLDFFYLLLSFLGWILLSVFMIPLIFTLPYMITSYAVHVRFAVAEYNKHIEKNETDEFQSFVAGF